MRWFSALTARGAFFLSYPVTLGHLYELNIMLISYLNSGFLISGLFPYFSYNY